jgi:hypothetical protein
MQAVVTCGLVWSEVRKGSAMQCRRNRVMPVVLCNLACCIRCPQASSIFKKQPKNTPLPNLVLSNQVDVILVHLWSHQAFDFLDKSPMDVSVSAKSPSLANMLKCSTCLSGTHTHAYCAVRKLRSPEVGSAKEPRAGLRSNTSRLFNAP